MYMRAGLISKRDSEYIFMKDCGQPHMDRLLLHMGLKVSYQGRWWEEITDRFLSKVQKLRAKYRAAPPSSVSFIR